MNVKETDFPEKFRPIIRRLQAAVAEKEILDVMTVEDDFLQELNDYENRIAEQTKQKEEERRQKEEALRKQEEERKQKQEAIKLLLSLGISHQEISQKLGIPIAEIKALEERK